MAQTFKSIFSQHTHEGRVLECFGFATAANGTISLMRWVQTPYHELATPPVVFDITREEWKALLGATRGTPLPPCLPED